ncbi:MAG: TIGR00730 family Rossman fold protein [Actinomycetota bacterium]|nr:TIGR00730 family Rossman fold protein [Actinomycetota bacterium]
MEQVCVFCGSSDGSSPVYLEAARRTGEEIARRGLGLVYGGGKVGLMGAVADAALAAGGEVVGVMPDALVSKEIGHEGLTKLRVVGSMHERKKLMADLSDGFVALPGGYGTLEEFLEVLSWAQLSMHEKPCALLEVAGYWEPLTALFDRAVAEGFVRPNHRSLVLAGEDPGELLDLMERYRSPAEKKWAAPEDR